MKRYYKEIIFGSVLTILFVGLIFWFGRQEADGYLKILIAVITVFLGIFAVIRNISAKKKEFASGMPTEDELTKLARIYAGSRAFIYSMYLWFLIFIFNYTFSERKEMLGIGILGSALIYGICLWYYKTTANFGEE
ncbi:MAG: hypothetical protein GXO77_02275 [Calditrichaeota bacterium]|nr:hypothetical protein [Calditrichota bacterium]